MSHIPDYKDPSPLQALAVWLFRTMPDQWRGLLAVLLFAGAIAAWWAAGGLSIAGFVLLMAGVSLAVVNFRHSRRR